MAISLQIMKEKKQKPLETHELNVSLNKDDGYFGISYGAKFRKLLFFLNVFINCLPFSPIHSLPSTGSQSFSALTSRQSDLLILFLFFIVVIIVKLNGNSNVSQSSPDQ